MGCCSPIKLARIFSIRRDIGALLVVLDRDCRPMASSDYANLLLIIDFSATIVL